jgi:hypothetical protein
MLNILGIILIESYRKITQPILKKITGGCNSVQSDWIFNTQYRCEYTRAHAGHVML